MKYLVTFIESENQLTKGAISNIYGVSAGVESGLVERTLANPIKPFMRFYGDGKNVDASGEVCHAMVSPDFVSKEYSTVRDMLEHEGRYLHCEHYRFLRRPYKYRY